MNIITFRQFKDKYRVETEGNSPNFEGGLIQVLHRLISDPEHIDFTEEPDELFDIIGYWECACYLMIVLLGWTNPAKGLLWWYKGKQDTYNDIRLRLLKEIWNKDDKLDLLAAWFWSQGQRFAGYFQAMSKHADNGLCHPIQYTPEKEWWEDFHRKFSFDKCQKSNPFFGGYNPLHLIHFGILWDTPSDIGKLEKIGKNASRAILTLPELKGWYTSLSLTSKELGLLGYTIDVIIKDIGWLGSFKHSPVTGLWYQGEHNIHLQGNLHPRVDGIHRWRDLDFFSKYDQRIVTPEASQFIKKMRYKAADYDSSLDFQFPLAGKYYSGKGMPRTILGYGFNTNSDPVYIIRLDDQMTIGAKRTYKAHQEYSSQIGFDYDVWQNSFKAL